MKSILKKVKEKACGQCPLAELVDEDQGVARAVSQDEDHLLGVDGKGALLDSHGLVAASG